MIRYVVTTYAHRPGAYLSRPGRWGNIPYPTTQAARQAAREDAGSAIYEITQNAVSERQARGK